MSERQKSECFEVQIRVFPETLSFRAVLEMQPRQCTDNFASKNKCKHDNQSTAETHRNHVFHEKVSLRKNEKANKCFKKEKRSKNLRFFLASAQKHLHNEAERCRVSTCGKYVKQLPSLGNSTTSNILSTCQNMHTMMRNSTGRRSHLKLLCVVLGAWQSEHSDHRSALS